MRALWKAQDLLRRLPKAGAGPQVAVAFETASLSAASADVVDFDAADKLAVLKATATCGPASAFGKRRRRSWAFHRASFVTVMAVLPSEYRQDCHGCGSRMQNEQKRLKKGQNNGKKDKRWRSSDNAA